MADFHLAVTLLIVLLSNCRGKQLKKIGGGGAQTDQIRCIVGDIVNVSTADILARRRRF